MREGEREKMYSKQPNIHKNSEARKSLKNIKDSQSWGFAGGRCGQWGPECGSVVRDKVERFPNKCFGVWTLRKVNRNAHEFKYSIMSRLPKYLECFLTSAFKHILVKIKTSSAAGT